MGVTSINLFSVTAKVRKQIMKPSLASARCRLSLAHTTLHVDRSLNSQSLHFSQCNGRESFTFLLMCGPHLSLGKGDKEDRVAQKTTSEKCSHETPCAFSGGDKCLVDKVHITGF